MKREDAEKGVVVQAIDPKTGELGDMSVLEDNDIAFDPTKATLDLTKAEKRRTTALMMAIQAYQHLIIKDAEILKAVSDESRRGGPTIQPATMEGMVRAAINSICLFRGGWKHPSRCLSQRLRTYQSRSQTRRRNGSEGPLPLA